MEKEIEVKFKIDEKDQIKEKLTALGVSLSEPYKQTTYGFFSKDSREKGIFPRIRNEKEDIVLTVKVKSKEETNYFERMEYSMKISSVKEGEDILKVLGFDDIKVFEKTRQEGELLNTVITLDELYFGNFIEIEGGKEEIENVIIKLGLENKERITKAYLRVEEDYKNGKL
ncbi:MAG: CYTH domain-containing protein [Candidatus Pacebacteria bacterium]|nr:CYTH domain-containing protein [Candidatus Paceibacterota bacterium]MDD2757403.1 CYTH domain-containing protein [Candidatus Paceibacterota bacterium]MDD3970060.1 CYTH domain-containing protein [Candidatus Paceibacterota bacterium]